MRFMNAIRSVRQLKSVRSHCISRRREVERIDHNVIVCAFIVCAFEHDEAEERDQGCDHRAETAASLQYRS